MKRLSILLLMLIGFGLSSRAQFAVDFTANDCSGNTHHLFSELDSGKVIVLTWVMPCASCQSATSSAASLISGLGNARVKHYVADDYANTSCATLQTWLNSISVAPHAVFSSSSIKMSDYGTAGMPKTVILGGGTQHLVYLNANGNLLTRDFLTALNTALSVNHVSDIVEKSFYLYPNPASTKLNIILVENTNYSLPLVFMDMCGKVIKRDILAPSKFSPIPQIDISDLQIGNYIVQIGNHFQSLTVAR
jgi:hypothetical protein